MSGAANYKRFGLKKRGYCHDRSTPYVELDVNEEIERVYQAGGMLTRAIRRWEYICLNFEATDGGAAVKKSFSAVLSVMGLVAALLSALILTGMVSPPNCDENDSAGCRVSGVLVKIYGVIQSGNLMNCLVCLTFSAFATNWIGLYRDDEMVYYLREYTVFTTFLPIMTVASAIIGIILAEGIRIWIVFGLPATCFYGGLGLFYTPIFLYFVFKSEFNAEILREAYRNKLLKEKKANNGTGNTPITTTEVKGFEEE